MYLVFPLKTVAYLFGVPLLLVFLVLLSVKGGSLVSLVSQSVLITVILFWVIGATPVWRKLWQWIPQLNKWVFPDLNGLWLGVQESNWSVIKRLVDTAKNQQETFDCEQSDMELLNTQIKVRVKANLFRIQVELESQPRSADPDKPYSSSYTYITVPRKHPDREAFELYYFYKNTTTNPLTTDTSSHDGAAKLEITATGEKWQMTGRNMTDRQWRKGMNTAGNLTLEHISEDPEGDFPQKSVV